MLIAHFGVDWIWKWALCLPLWIPTSPTLQDQDQNPRPPGLEQLRLLGEIELDASRGSAPPDWSAWRFTIDPQGRFVTLGSYPQVLAVIDNANGRVLSTIAAAETVGWSRPAILGPEKLLLIRDSFSRSSVRLSQSVNWAQGETSEFPTSTPLLAEEVWMGMAGPDSRVLVSWDQLMVRGWTTDGRLVWTLTPAERIANVDAVCSTTNGLIAILDRRGEVGIQFVYPEGRVGPYIHLKEKWGRDAIWPLDIHPAENGGLWVVEGAEGGTRLTRTDAGCGILEERTPRYRNGARLTGDVAVDPSGQPWMCDDTAFVRVGPDGWVDRVIGESREKAPLRDASMVRIGPDGRIYAASERDHSVHVFDDSGSELRVERPTAYAEDGETPRGMGELEWVEKRWYPIGETKLRWEVEDHLVRLVDPVFGEIRVYRDSEWPETETSFEGAGTSPDGRLAVTVFRRTNDEHSLLHVVILDPNQEQTRKQKLPGSIPWLSSIAFDGKRIAIANDVFIEAFDCDSRSLLRVSLPGGGFRCGNAPDTDPRLAFAQGGSELWLWEGAIGTKISRYAMP